MSQEVSAGVVESAVGRGNCIIDVERFLHYIL